MANRLTDDPARVEAWRQQRRTFLGASESAAVAGLNRYETPLGVWAAKVMPEAATMTNPQRWGLMLERVVAEAYAETTGRELAEPAEPYRHAEYPWLGATVDRETDCGRVVELKTASQYAAKEWGEPGTDEIPDHYLVQVQHQLFVTGRPAADVAVLIGGSDFRVYTVEFNPAVMEGLLPALAEFWLLVERRTPPPPDWSHPATAGLVERLHTPVPGRDVELPAAALGLAAEYERLGEAAKTAERERATVKARLAEMMASAETGRLPDGRRVRRRTVERKGYTVEASSYVEFRILKAKGG